jgi:hypothetical protein
VTPAWSGYKSNEISPPSADTFWTQTQTSNLPVTGFGGSSRRTLWSRLVSLNITSTIVRHRNGIISFIHAWDSVFSPGCAATGLVLSFGLVSFYRRNTKMSQTMMRARIAAQGFTVFALVLGVFKAASGGSTDQK